MKIVAAFMSYDLRFGIVIVVPPMIWLFPAMTRVVYSTLFAATIWLMSASVGSWLFIVSASYALACNLLLSVAAMFWHWSLFPLQCQLCSGMWHWTVSASHALAFAFLPGSPAKIWLIPCIMSVVNLNLLCGLCSGFQYLHWVFGGLL